MVARCLLLLFIFISGVANAQISLFLNRHLWQENVSVLINEKKSSQMTTFSSWGVGLGYKWTFAKRYIYEPSLEFHSGEADVHKVDETLISPRKKFTATWFSNAFIYRVTKTFNVGLSVVVNSRSVTDLGQVITSGAQIVTEYELFDDVHLNQNIGTIGDGRQLSYALGISRNF